MPASGMGESFPLAIRKALHQYFPDIRYYCDRIESTSFHHFFTDLPNPCCVAVMGLKPFREKGFIELDPLLSALMIEKLLGGKGEERADLSPLTETEQGVIEFLLLKLFSEIHKISGEKAKIHFRLEQMIMEPSRLRVFEREKQEMVCLKVHVSLLKAAGFVNIYLPHPWIVEGFLKDLPGDKTAARQKAMKENLKNFDFLPVTVWGCLGEASLSFEDLKTLEEGDVLLFDKTGIKKKGKAFKGEIDLRVGKTTGGSLKAGWEGFAAGGECRLKSS